MDTATIDRDHFLASGRSPSPPGSFYCASPERARYFIVSDGTGRAYRSRRPKDTCDPMARHAGREIQVDAALGAGRGQLADVDRLRGCGRSPPDPRDRAAKGDHDSSFAGRWALANCAPVVIGKSGSGDLREHRRNGHGPYAAAAPEERISGTADRASAFTACGIQWTSPRLQRCTLSAPRDPMQSRAHSGSGADRPAGYIAKRTGQ